MGEEMISCISLVGGMLFLALALALTSVVLKGAPSPSDYPRITPLPKAPTREGGGDFIKQVNAITGKKRTWRDY